MKLQIEYILTGILEIDMPEDSCTPWQNAKDFIYGQSFKNLIKNLDKNILPQIEEVNIIEQQEA